MNDITIICPYINEQEIMELKSHLDWDLKVLMEKDNARIGSDLMYQKLWNKAKPDDIFILHSDMIPLEPCWFTLIKSYVEKYPEAGMFGCKLLYPIKTQNQKHLIQSAGGKFTNFVPDHFGSGFDMFTQRSFKQVEEDSGQYDKVREVAWSTFGGLYIRREVLDQVGDFDPSYEWSYNRDVDYCLESRKKGWKIYQIPVPIYHFESKDNKRLRQANSELNEKENRNLQKLIAKWKDTEYYKTIDKVVDEALDREIV